LLVRPEDVELTLAENGRGLEGVIREVRYRGDRYEQDVEVAGMLLRAIQFKNRGRAALRRPGQSVRVRFTRHRVFEVEEDHAAIRAQLQSLGYIE
jgi:ABC-type Fe3+/spermidine/putrescine transport system ATPase subunit